MGKHDVQALWRQEMGFARAAVRAGGGRRALRDGVALAGGQARRVSQDQPARLCAEPAARLRPLRVRKLRQDRKSTRLNSSHSQISYAVFCLKKKKKIKIQQKY